MIGYANLVSLEQLRPNEEGSVVELVGPDRDMRRLAEMGLSVGASVRMVRPGSPCLVAIGAGTGKRMSLRLNDGVEILVAAQAL